MAHMFLLYLQTFSAPSFDDKILEVVAVFGSTQLAVSRVIDLQHHRIAQVSVFVCFELTTMFSTAGLSTWVPEFQVW